MRINHPRPALGRQRALGLEFIDGVAVVDSLHPERELALRQHGYTIEADPDVEAPFQEALGEPIIDLEKLTKAELRDLLPKDAEVPAKASHAELVKRVSELPAEPIPASVNNGDGTFTVAQASVAVEMPGGEVVGDTGVTIATLSADSADEASDFED